MSPLNNQIDHVKFLIAQGGVGKIINHINENVAFDIRHGTRTSEWLPRKKFALQPANLNHGVKYRAAATSEVVRALNFVSKKMDISKAGFFDMGCGKGKVLCIAGLKYGFKEIHGVDYYPPFLMQAERNIEKCDLEDAINLHSGDMTQFDKFSETSVVFFYNPAGEKIIDDVRKNIETHTKKAIVIYNKPEHSEVFEDWDVLYRKGSEDPDHRTTIFGRGF